MSTEIVTWDQQADSIGEAVAAIGVFDGVHLGHQALLTETVEDAEYRGVRSVAVTFDRDPDQVVSPHTAAPQLLTLPDKLAFIAACGVDAILVIPFTHTLAEMSPEDFLDSVLLRGLGPIAVHVGGDFRFGHCATGDVTTLRDIGGRLGFEVIAHELVSLGGAPITSTRIRSLVAAGDVSSAAELLGRPTRVTGLVHRGRGEGASLGFPTANMIPVEFAALPADGVYAGRAVLPSGDTIAAAISVGTPPSFPQARDYLEAHLIGFEGNLYDTPLTLEFIQRLRGQGAYPSLEALKAAISADVAASSDIAEIAAAGGVSDLDDGIDDPDALEAAEQAVRRADRQPRALLPEPLDGWKTVVSDVGYDRKRLGEMEYALAAAGIAAEWRPFSPTEAPLLKLFGLRETRFSLRVPEVDVEAARELLAEVDARS